MDTKMIYKSIHAPEVSATHYWWKREQVTKRDNSNLQQTDPPTDRLIISNTAAGEE